MALIVTMAVVTGIIVIFIAGWRAGQSALRRRMKSMEKICGSPKALAG